MSECTWPAQYARGDVRLLETAGLGHIRVLRDESVARAIADFVADSAPACGHGRPRGGRGCEDCALEEELFSPSRRQRSVDVPPRAFL